jgi:hypothetical protein
LPSGLAIDGILYELAAARGTEIEPKLLIDIVSDTIAFSVLATLNDLLDLSEIISIVIAFIDFSDIHRSIDFHANHISQLVARIDQSLTAITGVLNHGIWFPESSIVRQFFCPEVLHQFQRSY